MAGPTLPPFTDETDAQKVPLTENTWNGREAERVAPAYTEHNL